MFNPNEICHYEFQSSCIATAPLVKMITDQRLELSPEECHEMDLKIKEAKSCITNTKVYATNRYSVISKASCLNHCRKKLSSYAGKGHPPG